MWVSLEIQLCLNINIFVKEILKRYLKRNVNSKKFEHFETGMVKKYINAAKCRVCRGL